MSSFEDRERAFENMFAHDEEMKFKAIARRNKMAGLWAAGLLGMSGEDADGYAMDVVRADFEGTGRNNVVRKLLSDLEGRTNEGAIRAKLDEMLAIAKDQLLREAE